MKNLRLGSIITLLTIHFSSHAEIIMYNHVDYLIEKKNGYFYVYPDRIISNLHQKYQTSSDYCDTEKLLIKDTFSVPGAPDSYFCNQIENKDNPRCVDVYDYLNSYRYPYYPIIKNRIDDQYWMASNEIQSTPEQDIIEIKKLVSKELFDHPDLNFIKFASESQFYGNITNISFIYAPRSIESSIQKFDFISQKFPKIYFNGYDIHTIGADINCDIIEKNAFIIWNQEVAFHYSGKLNASYSEFSNWLSEFKIQYESVSQKTNDFKKLTNMIAVKSAVSGAIIGNILNKNQIISETDKNTQIESLSRLIARNMYTPIDQISLNLFNKENEEIILKSMPVINGK